MRFQHRLCLGYAGLHREASRWTAWKYQGMRVVLDMTTGLRGHRITCDIFFYITWSWPGAPKKTSDNIWDHKKKQAWASTCSCFDKSRDRYSSVFAFTGTHSLVSYCPKKAKFCVSDEHLPQKRQSKRHSGQEASSNLGLQPVQRRSWQHGQGISKCDISMHC